jgi:hypothetical protein
VKTWFAAATIIPIEAAITAAAAETIALLTPESIEPSIL